MPNLVGIGLSQVPTNSMLGGMAYQDPEHASIKNLDLKNLSQINSEIADTAVDVFVYDTSKDSDGGAWRKRTQHTSWYNETLNTATRGSRKEFPAVAVIVAETTKVTIYDGDDPDLPMWMEFDAGEQTANGKMLQFWGTATTGVVSSVTMLNGEMVVGTNNGSSSGVYVGMTAVNFASDSAYYRRNASDQYIIIGNPISDRNVNQYGGYPTTGGLGGGNVNDVAMTVLPNAPIDSATGLPVPTIAVATDGGVSVIKDDGTVVDLNVANRPYSSVDFTSDNLIFAVENPSGVSYDLVRYFEVPSSDITNASTYGPSSTPALFPTNTKGNIFDSFAYGSPVGLSLIDHANGTAAATSGMIAYVASDYNTGWMHGNIKGAFLSDTDTTNLTGGNLVSNGDAWSGALSSTSSTPPTGWTGGLGAKFRTNSGGDGTYLNLVNAGSGQGGPNSYMFQAITTVAGRKYKISLTQYHHATITVFFAAATTSGGTDLLNKSWTSSSSNTPRYEQSTFTATGTTTYIRLGVISGTNDYWVGWDDVVVAEVDEDRSVNANGLHSFGTITKSAVATGAELVAYSGFSASNYLKQPYNSDLAPGTAAYSVSCWFKTGTSSGDQYIFDRNGGGAGSRNLLLIMNTSAGNANKLQWWHRDNTGNTTDVQITDKTVTDNVWHQVVALNDGSTYKLYVDGEVSSVTSSQIRNVISDNNPPMFVGIRHTGGSTFMTGSMALFRYSKSAPSPEQIKKMYEDEKYLFHENAKATLYGSSDAVTALAFDDTTNLLHVGTSAGRSEFQGLRRINNTTDAVTTAISASNGLVAEQ